MSNRLQIYKVQFEEKPPLTRPAGVDRLRCEVDIRVGTGREQVGGNR